jgi:SAM-dependent methyltransferase
MNLLKIKLYISKYINKYGKLSFASKLDYGSRVVDLGCGNSWSLKLKTIRPDLFYIGVDIQNYKNDNSLEYIDDFVLIKSDEFHKFNEKIESLVDACIWSHNIEHLERPIETLNSVVKILKPGGFLYLSFPSKVTLELPSRKGTLNFHDDPTHVYLPDLNKLSTILVNNEYELKVIKEENKPLIPYLIGMILEPLSKILKINLYGTWSYHGYETVIIAKRK